LVNSKLNDRLTLLEADNESLRTQLTDANAALAKVMFSTAAAATIQNQYWLYYAGPVLVLLPTLH